MYSVEWKLNQYVSAWAHCHQLDMKGKSIMISTSSRFFSCKEEELVTPKSHAPIVSFSKKNIQMECPSMLPQWQLILPTCHSKPCHTLPTIHSFFLSHACIGVRRIVDLLKLMVRGSLNVKLLFPRFSELFERMVLKV